MASAKGTLLTNLAEYVEARHSAGAWRAVVDSLAADDRAIIDGLLLVGGWYPVGLWNRAVAAYIRRFATDADAEMAAVARHIAEHDLHTLFKLLVKQGAPEAMLGRTDSIWSRYFDAGHLENAEVDRRRWSLKLTAPMFEEDAPGELTCGPGMCGWLTQALRQSGVVMPRVVHTRCRFHGVPSCEYDVTW